MLKWLLLLFSGFNVGLLLTTTAASPSIPPTPTVYPLPIETEEVEANLPDDFGELIAESAHFDYYQKDGYFPVDLDWFMAEAEAAYDYASEKIGVAPDVIIAINFDQREEGNCVIRGMAGVRSGPLYISIFLDEDTPEAELLGILAHEVAHIVHGAGLAGGMSPHPGLNEGLATWASADYWLAWNHSESLAAMVHGFIEDGSYLPLYENYRLEPAYAGDDCLTERDILYTEWAAFIDFLVAEYGWEQFVELLYSGQPETRRIGRKIIEIRYPAAYEEIYDLSLNQLEAQWVLEIAGN